LITTKRGKSGRFRVNFRHQTDIAERLKDGRKVLNQDQYLDLLYEAYRNANPVQWATDQTIFNDLKLKFPYRVINGDTSFYPADDWNVELYKSNALTITNDLSLSGGNENTNLESRPISGFNFGINTQFTYSHQKLGDFGETITSINGFAQQAAPLLPIRDSSGQYIIRYPFGAGGATIVNPVASLDYNKENTCLPRFRKCLRRAKVFTQFQL
jgi:hypothetical protein